MSSMAKLNKKSPATAPCLTAVTTSNDVWRVEGCFEVYEGQLYRLRVPLPLFNHSPNIDHLANRRSTMTKAGLFITGAFFAMLGFMSSLSRGATGTSKSKPVNVNNLYSGRNLAAGTKSLVSGKHGLTSVGKSVGVVRRMPPPATLPSLKAENNGQDPNTAVVPQGGAGWSKGDASIDFCDAVRTSTLCTSSGPDLRPTWAKPHSDAISAQGIDASHKLPKVYLEQCRGLARREEEFDGMCMASKTSNHFQVFDEDEFVETSDQ
ncbi:hypothetical protein RB195_022884 [Necator americanus]|uniref:BAT2 N-terminal domain-containing protein n=1 Tax=Necator americanus TaxID=51031 RepID=A0ABR1EH62_NECAM